MQTSSQNQPHQAETQQHKVRRVVWYLVTISPVLLLIALLAWGQLRGNPGGLVVHNELGEVAVAERQAPAFQGTDLATGEPIDSADLRGEIVMVDFWSSWCVACRVEAEALASVYLEYQDRPVEFVGLAIWDQPQDVLDHIERFGVAYPNMLDPRGESAVAYGVSGVPEKYFLDREGRIVKKVIGPVTEERLRAILDELLAA